jgi:hypothetical protein
MSETYREIGLTGFHFFSAGFSPSVVLGAAVVVAEAAAATSEALTAGVSAAVA